MTRLLKWNRSVEGYCDSKDGRFSISPLYCGRVKPIFWMLTDNKTKRQSRSHFTQHEAKEAADRMINPPPKPTWVIDDSML